MTLNYSLRTGKFMIVLRSSEGTDNNWTEYAIKSLEKRS